MFSSVKSALFVFKKPYFKKKRKETNIFHIQVQIKKKYIIKNDYFNEFVKSIEHNDSNQKQKNCSQSNVGRKY